MRILITGSRAWDDAPAMKRVLSSFDTSAREAVPTLISGACPCGSDALAEMIAARLGWDVELHPPAWQEFGKAATVRRDRSIVALGADVCLEFVCWPGEPQSPVARLADKAGIRTIRFTAPTPPAAPVASAVDADRTRRLDRPPEWVIDVAIEAANTSPCKSQHGAVIWSAKRLIGVGYNRPPEGFVCTQNKACKAHCRTTAVHAAQWALMTRTLSPVAADMLHVKTVDSKLVASGEPSCLRCSTSICAAGVAAMWLYRPDGWRRYPAREWHRLTLLANDRPVPRRP